MATVQMNVRIDEELKSRGDAVFASMGLSTTEVVRAVWSYAAEHGDVPGIVSQALEQPADRSRQLDVEYRLAAAENARNLVANFRERFGIGAPDELEDIDYASLREEAWRDRMVERGLA